jgi:hypothetical protein
LGKIIKQAVYGFFTALQSVIISLIPFFLFAFFVLLFDPPIDLADTPFFELVLEAGTRFWLAGCFLPLKTSTLFITLAPLGTSASIALICYLFSRKNPKNSLVSALFSSIFYASFALLAAFILNITGDYLYKVFIFGTLISGVGYFFALLYANKYDRLDVGNNIKKAIGVVQEKVADGKTWILSLIIPLGLFVAVSALFAASTISNGYEVLGLDTANGLILIVSQLLYLPNIAVWLSSMAVGSGFSIGSTAHFSIFQDTNATLPTIPILGIVPSESQLPDMQFLKFIPILLIFSLGVFFTFRMIKNMLRENEAEFMEQKFLGKGTSIVIEDSSSGMFLNRFVSVIFTQIPISTKALKELFVKVLTGDLIVFLFFFALGFLSSGSLGENNLSLVGVNPAQFSLALTFEFFLGQILILSMFCIYKLSKRTKVKVEL